MAAKRKQTTSTKQGRPSAKPRPAIVPEPTGEPVGEMVTTLAYRCTETGEASTYDVPGDAKALKDLWSRTLSVTCPQCRQIHRVPFREAYVNAMIANAAPVWVERV